MDTRSKTRAAPGAAPGVDQPVETEIRAEPDLPVEPDLAHQRVGDVMSTPALAVTLTVTVAAALRLMVVNQVRHLVVVDTGGRCQGVLSDRTLVGAWALDPGDLESQWVGALLDSSPAVVTVDTSVSVAAATMYRYGVDAVAVVERHGGSGVVGVLTATDLVRLLGADVEAVGEDADEGF